MLNSGVNSIHDFRKKISSNYEFISTAYHEAGHTIYGLLHYIKIISVSVFENKQTKRVDGFTHYANYFHSGVTDPKLISDIVKSEICISYAGLSAEKYHYKLLCGSDKFPIFLRDGSSEDTVSASTLIKKFNLAAPGKKRYILKQRLIKECSDELQLHWEAVTLVAHAIFQKKKIHYNNLKELLTKKSINKKFWKDRFKKIDYIYDNDGSLDEKDLKSIMSL